MTSLTKKLTAALLAVTAAVCLAFGLFFVVPRASYADAVTDTLVTLDGTDYLDIEDGVFKGLKDKDADNTVADLLKNKNLKIQLPEGVTSVAAGKVTAGNVRQSVLGAYASKLEALALPSGLTAIGDYAFLNCTALGEVNLPSAVKSLGESAFQGCASLRDVNVVGMGNLETIGKNAFSGCTRLTAITIPHNVKDIGAGAFNGCSSVTVVNYFAANVASAYTVASPFKGIGKAVVKINGATKLPAALFYSTAIKEVHFEGVKLGATAWPAGTSGVFENCASLTKVTFDADCNIATIGGNAFKNCALLEGIDFPAGIKTIGREAFSGCANIISLTLPVSLETIEDRAFLGCTGLLEIIDKTGSGLASTGAGSITANNSAEIIGREEDTNFSTEGDFLFYSSGADKYLVRYTGTATDVTLPATGSYKIYKNAFKDNSAITSVNIPSNVTAIGENAFMNCSALTSITIPDSVNEIGAAAFYGCSSLTAVSLAEGIGSIGVQMFMNCTSLKSITVPSSVTTIASSAFQNCTRLETVKFTPYEMKGAVGSGDENKVIDTFYRVTKIESEAFKGCTSLRSISIYDAKTIKGAATAEAVPVSFGGAVFENCTKLETANIPASATFNSKVFDGCPNVLLIAPDERSYKTYQSTANLQGYKLTYNVEIVLKNVGTNAPEDKTVYRYYGIEGQDLPVQDGYEISVWYRTKSGSTLSNKFEGDWLDALLTNPIAGGKIELYAYYTEKPDIGEDKVITASNYSAGIDQLTGANLKLWFTNLSIGMDDSSTVYTADIVGYTDMSGKICPPPVIVVDKETNTTKKVMIDAGTYTVHIVINNPESKGVWADGVEFKVGVSPAVLDIAEEIEWGIANGNATSWLAPDGGTASEPVSLYRYNGKWYTEKQYKPGSSNEELEHDEDYEVKVLRSYVIWNGSEKTVCLMKETSSTYFKFVEYTGEIRATEGGMYIASATVTMDNNYTLPASDSVAAFKNYGLSALNTQVNNRYIISKTWYIVTENANRLLSESDTGYVIDGWRYMDDIERTAPKLAQGDPAKYNELMSFSLSMYADESSGDALISDLTFKHSGFGKVINKAMPAGYYRLTVTVKDVEIGGKVYEGGTNYINFLVDKALPSSLVGLKDEAGNPLITADKLNHINGTKLYADYTGKVTFGINEKILPVIGLNPSLIHPDTYNTVWFDGYEEFYTGFVIKYQYATAGGAYLTQDEYTGSEPSAMREHSINYIISAPGYGALEGSYTLAIQGAVDKPAVSVTYNGKSWVDQINFNNQYYYAVYLDDKKSTSNININSKTLREDLIKRNAIPASTKADDYVNAGEHYVVLYIHDEFKETAKWRDGAGAIDSGYGKCVVLKFEIAKANNSTTIKPYVKPWDWGTAVGTPTWTTAFPTAQQFKIVLQSDPDNPATTYWYAPTDDQLGFGDAPAGDYYLVPIAEETENVKEFDTSAASGADHEEWYAFTISKETIVWATTPHMDSWKYGDDELINAPGGKLADAFKALEGTWATYICREDEYGKEDVDKTVTSVAQLKEKHGGHVPAGTWVYVYELPESDNYEKWVSPVYFSVLGADNYWDVTPVIHDFVYGGYSDKLISELGYMPHFGTKANVSFEFRYFDVNDSLIVSWKNSIADLQIMDENGQIPVGKYEYRVTVDASSNYDKLVFGSEFFVTVAENSWISVPNIVGWSEGRYSFDTNAPAAQAEFGTVYFTVKDADGNVVAGLDHITASYFTAEKLKSLGVGNYKLIAEVEASKNGDYNALSAEVNFAVFEDSVGMAGLIAATMVFAVIAVGLAVAGVILLIRRNKKIEQEFRNMVKSELKRR